MRRPVSWVITDTHFNDRKIIERGNRPADYVERMFGHLKRMVHSSDRIYHLGDVIWSRASELSDYMRRMPCQSILVRGNHDHNSNAWYESHGFHYVATHIVLDDVILSHKPLEVFPDGVRFNVHGHLHDDDHRHAECAAFYDTNRHYLVAMENTDYAPLSMDSIRSYMESKT